MNKKKGYFGSFGGQFVPELLIQALKELEKAYEYYSNDPSFKRELEDMLKHYAGRPSPLFLAKSFGRTIKSKARIYLKREDLNHTGAHKINNALGQALLAKRMGKTELIAETGAGQHGVATATVSAFLRFERCTIFMGESDIERQAVNVQRMKLLGANVLPVYKGQATLKDAINEAMRYWVSHLDYTHYLFGTVAGPHPYPTIVRNFQVVVGRETKTQIMEREGRLPTRLIACVGGGSNAMGLFYPFIEHKDIALIGVEAGGLGKEMGQHAASLSLGDIGVLHGAKSFILQRIDGQIAPVHSISAGLDYPGVGPELACLKESGRASFYAVLDYEAIHAFKCLCKTEGILPALESAHALAWAVREAESFKSDDLIVINLSGRGDKDLSILKNWEDSVGPIL